MHFPMEPHALETSCIILWSLMLWQTLLFYFSLWILMLWKPHAFLYGVACSGKPHAFPCGASCSGSPHTLPCEASFSSNLYILPYGASLSRNPLLQVLILGSRQNPTTLHWIHYLLVVATHSLLQTHLPYGFQQHNLGLDNTKNTFTTLSSFHNSFLFKLFFNSSNFFCIQFKKLFFSFITQISCKIILLLSINELL